MPDGAMQPAPLLPPHAPYRERPAEFRIGLAPIPVEQWFEGGETDPASRKDALLAAHAGVVWREVEGSRPAQAEALAMISAWLGRSAPSDGDPPLLAAARLVDDDLCLMERREDGWTLTAASLCASTFFTAGQAVGQSLAELHVPVTSFGERLLPRIARIFDALQPDTILERSNWTVVNSDELFLPDPAPVRAALTGLTPEKAADALFVRMERQTIRKLPQTGAVLFTIRVWRHALAELAADPVRLAAFARAWAEVMADPGEAFRTYKRLDLYDPWVRTFLRAHSFAV
jgi:hypothetical protein